MQLSIDIPVNASLKKVMKTTVEQVEKAYIQKTFLKAGYKKYETSKLLGIGLKTLYGKLNKHNLCLRSREPNEKKKEQTAFPVGITLQEASYRSEKNWKSGSSLRPCEKQRGKNIMQPKN